MIIQRGHYDDNNGDSERYMTEGDIVGKNDEGKEYDVDETDNKTGGNKDNDENDYESNIHGDNKECDDRGSIE